MSIYSMIYRELKTRIKELPEYRQYGPAFNMLDREEIADIILDGKTFWFEWYNTILPTDRSILNLMQYLRSKGYIYLYG